MPLLDAIIAIDTQVAVAVNAFAARPTTFNHLVVLLTGEDFIKMAPFVAVFVWFWNRPPHAAHRLIVLRGMAGIFAAFFAGRILQLGLPMRMRPMHDAALGLAQPAFTSHEMLGGWSSFPSDHAAIFGAAVCLVFALSRPLGVLAALYAILVVLLPRLYVGVHFPTDILAGCLLGMAAGLAALTLAAGARLARAVLRFAERHPALFHTAAVIYLIQLSELFHEAREYASVLKGLWIGKF